MVSNGYFFFFLAVFFAFFAFFAFLAMLPSVIPNVVSNASRQSTCRDSEYTKTAELILRAAKRVNDRHAVASRDQTRASRHAWTQRAEAAKPNYSHC